MSTNEILKYLEKNEERLFVIHYSCENLNDNNQNYSPRITSIAVIHLKSYTTHSFSLHLIAEELDIKRDDITSKYNDIEKQMLEKFYDFVKNLQNPLWLHWNMSNINFGFEAIAHRYKVLTKKDAPTIQDTSKYNLSWMILQIYGKDCVDNPRMPNLMDLNGGRPRDVLLGEDEVKAFQNQEYIKLHKSTMSKANWFESMYYKLQKRKIKTTRTNWMNRLNTFLEHPYIKLVGFFAVLFTVIQFCIYIIEKVSK